MIASVLTQRSSWAVGEVLNEDHRELETCAGSVKFGELRTKPIPIGTVAPGSRYFERSSKISKANMLLTNSKMLFPLHLGKIKK